MLHTAGTVLPPGAKILADGTILLADGTRLPPGAKVLPDGTVVMPDGTRILPDGTKILADGTRVLLDGTQILPDGSRVLPNGDVVLADGTVLTGADAEAWRNSLAEKRRRKKAKGRRPGESDKEYEARMKVSVAHVAGVRGACAMHETTILPRSGQNNSKHTKPNPGGMQHIFLLLLSPPPVNSKTA